MSKTMSMDILKKDIKDNAVRKLYLFYGPEEYLKKYYLESVQKLIVDKGMEAVNKIVLEGKQDVAKMIDCCETMPVFSERKLVVIKNSGFFKSKKDGEPKKGKSRSKGDELTAFLQEVPEHVCLIFYEPEADKRLKLVDIIRKHGLVVEFAIQKPAELVKWTVKVFKSYEKEIDTMTASRLVENCEQGMTEILNEITKVVLFSGDRKKISEKDIESVCIRSIKSRIFDLTDAIAEKNAALALKLLDDMISLKEPLQKILFMIARQFRHVMEMKLLRSKGMGVDEAAAKIGITAYAAGKALKQAGLFTTEQLKKSLEECLELDIAIKTGRIHDRIAAELLIAKFSSVQS